MAAKVITVALVFLLFRRGTEVSIPWDAEALRAARTIFTKPT